MSQFKQNTFYDPGKSTKTRLSRSGSNLYFLGILSGWMICRIKYDLIQLHFKSADNFARDVTCTFSANPHLFKPTCTYVSTTHLHHLKFHPTSTYLTTYLLFRYPLPTSILPHHSSHVQVFSRCERVSTAFMVLFLNLLANMMFIDVKVGGDPNNTLQIGPIKLSPEIIGKG